MSKAMARDPIYRRRRFQLEIIELCVWWYLAYRLFAAGGVLQEYASHSGLML